MASESEETFPLLEAAPTPWAPRVDGNDSCFTAVCIITAACNGTDDDNDCCFAAACLLTAARSGPDDGNDCCLQRCV